VTNISQHL